MKTFLAFLLGLIVGFSLALYIGLTLTEPLNPVRPTSARPAACWRAV